MLIRGNRAFAQAQPKWDTYSDTWVATDGLGRSLPTFDDVGPPKANKQVGIFYFLWVDGRTGVINDNNLYFQSHPNATVPYVKGAWHWWAEPLFGYYKIDDPFVLRKHAQMLQNAGIDTLAFDSTNAFLHEEQYTALCKVYTDIRSYGQKTPQFFHVTNAQSGKTTQTIYNEFYSKNLYSDLWFRWLGKPLILAHPEDLTPQLRDYFTVRYSWAYATGSGNWFKDGHDKWPWILSYPQAFGWHDAATIPEQTSVAVAHHAHTNRGRSLGGRMVNGVWQEEEPPPGQRRPADGTQFRLQSEQALKINPSFVFVTGWNEWIAPIGRGPGRKFDGHVLGPNDAFFVDQYTPEYSRDIEPMRPDAPNSFGDNFYYQLASFVRRYKGVRFLAPIFPQPVRIDGSFADWNPVGPEFRDDIGDPVKRDFPGFARGSVYRNTTGRNDIISAKVSYDSKNVYFYVRAKNILTPRTGKNWMQLYLDTDSNAKTGWMGYDFVVNRISPKESIAYVEKNIGGTYQWEITVPVAYKMKGGEMELSIPRAALGIKSFPATIDFKWADNCMERNDWSDFTLNGDAAPNDRFNYRAKLVAARKNVSPKGAKK